MKKVFQIVFYTVHEVLLVIVQSRPLYSFVANSVLCPPNYSTATVTATAVGQELWQFFVCTEMAIFQAMKCVG